MRAENMRSGAKEDPKDDYYGSQYPSKGLWNLKGFPPLIFPRILVLPANFLVLVRFGPGRFRLIGACRGTLRAGSGRFGAKEDPKDGYLAS